MLLDLKKFIGYICPSCGTVALKPVDIFDFSSGRGINLTCECHTSCMTIHPQKDVYRIMIECPICWEKHFFSIKSSTFWQEKLFTFQCPSSGIDIYYSGGNENEIYQKIEEQEQVFDEMEDDFSDTNSILLDMIDILQEMSENDRIYCTCGNRNISILPENNHVRLMCAACGHYHMLDLSEDGLNMLMDMDKLILEKKDD